MHVLLALALTASAAEPSAIPAPEPTVLLQTFATLFDQDEQRQADPAGYGDPEADIGFSVQRARVGLVGENEHFAYDLTVGASAPYDALSTGNTNVRIVNAWAAAKTASDTQSFELRFGTQRVPFGREGLQSIKDNPYFERSVGVELPTPGYQTGALLDWQLDAGLRVRAGAFNGTSASSGLFGDDNNGLMFSGRVEFAKGDMYARIPEAGTYGIAASAYHNTDVAVTTLGLGGDLFARVGPLVASFELGHVGLNPVRNTVATPPVNERTSRLGMTGQLAVVMEQDKGATQISARVSTYDDNHALSDNGDVAIAHLGVTRWDLLPGFDVGGGFIHRQELGGRTIPNDTARLWAQVRWPHS